MTNAGNVTLGEVAVDETIFTGAGPVPVPACPVSSLGPGDQTTCTATYTLMQADIDSGSISNTAYATGQPPTGEPVIAPASSVTIPQNAQPAVMLLKSATPATVTAAGQTVTYTFVVTNTGNVTLTKPAVQEKAFTGTGDIDAGSLTNVAVATGEQPSGPKVFAAASSVTIPQTPNPELTVRKTADPARISAAGQKVTYTFLVTNTGNVSLTNLKVHEHAFSGTGTAPVPSCPAAETPMLPGIEITCTAEYTATQIDVEAGSILNTATASGTPTTQPPVGSAPSMAIVAAGGPAEQLFESVVQGGSTAQEPASAPEGTLPRTGSGAAGLLRAGLGLTLLGAALRGAGRWISVRVWRASPGR